MKWRTGGCSLTCACAILLAGIAHAADVAPVHHEPNALNSAKAKKAHYVVMVSLDGFRWDYASKWGAPHLLKMGEEGASAPEGMLPSYPSVTFLNHYSLVRPGSIPKHHGIVGNEFRDPKRGYAEYVNSAHASSSDGSWYGGVPLWSLTERKKMRSASMYWSRLGGGDRGQASELLGSV